MKVCVIGGAGYIGSHTVYELIRAGHEVVVIDNLSTGKKEAIHENAKFYLGDITKKDELSTIFNEECASRPFDVVMHFAAKLIVPESLEMPLEYYHNNVEGVRVMLEVMVENNIKDVVFSSTAAVYGDTKNLYCTEEDKTDLETLINPYAATKLSSEQMIKWVTKRYGMNYCIFRYFNVAGADESLEIGMQKNIVTNLIPLVVENALGYRESVSVFGNDYDTKDGTCIRDYIHVSDLAYAHVLGAEYINKNNKSLLLNLGTGKGFSVLEVIDAVNKYLAVNYKIAPRRDGDPASVVASNEKAKEILGWEPVRDLDKIVKTEIEFMRKLRK